MLKNKLYPFVEKYINEYLYGFSKEQIQVGLTNGTIALDNLNIRPDKVNEKLNDKNLPIWLKAGVISKISINCSLMNFIGELPLNVLIDGVDVIVTPSYKWIIKNLSSFVEENEHHINDPYDPNDNNSYDIFSKKLNIFDNSVFKPSTIIEIFKDRSKISQLINKIFQMCFKFYYMKNHLVNATVKNIHIRFEDDQLVNYLSNIALGCRISSVEVNLSSEGIMKRNSFKLEKLDVYWESKPKILIPSDVLNNSFDKDNKLDEKYYAMLKKLNFGKFSYVNETKFLIENFNCMGKFGTQALNSSNSLDLFGKRENNFKLYVQFASSELNINIFPDLLIIASNFRKFMREFYVIEQAQDFKPMKKPYNWKNPLVNDCLKDKNNKIFPYKRKMVVRDWMFYFYWCRKCNSSIYGRNINPLRLEFIRFFNLCFTNWESEDNLVNSIDMKKEKDKKDGMSSVIDKSNAVNIPTPDNPNPENVILSFLGEFLVKAVNIHLHSSVFTSQSNSPYVTVNLAGVEIKNSLSNDQCNLNITLKSFGLGPNILFQGERMVVSSNNNNKADSSRAPIQNTIDMAQSKKISNNIIMRPKINNPTDAMMKNNPFLAQKMKILNEALNTNNDINPNKNPTGNELERVKNGRGIQQSNSTTGNNIISNTTIKRKNSNASTSFLNDIMQDTSSQQKEMEKISQTISVSKQIEEYNLKRMKRPPTISSVAKSSNLQQQAKKGQTTVVPLSLLEIYSYPNTPAISIQYSKGNNSSKGDLVKMKLGFICANLFEQYVSTCLSIVSEYQSILNTPTKAHQEKMAQSIKQQKQLFIMKKYIYDYLNKSKEAKSPQIIQYIAYLKKEIDLSNNMFMNDKGSFEINYIFSLFSRGIEIDFDYENFECAYYKKEKNLNQILGRALIPRIDLQIMLDLSRIYLRFFDFEFEINDLENTKILMNTLMTILSEKLKKNKIFIEPCFKELRIETDKMNENTETFIQAGNEGNNRQILHKNTGGMMGMNIDQGHVSEKNIHQGILGNIIVGKKEHLKNPSFNSKSRPEDDHDSFSEGLIDIK